MIWPRRFSGFHDRPSIEICPSKEICHKNAQKKFFFYQNSTNNRPDKPVLRLCNIYSDRDK